MKLLPARHGHLLELMSWFPDRESCEIWGGPDFRYPFTEASFVEDLHLDETAALCLLGEDDELLGFGQYYPREGRCHLARLVVPPHQRGRGLGRALITRLIEEGCADLGVGESSLFVLAHNEPAMRCYRGLGFEAAPYPGEMPEIEGCIYMVRGPG